MKKKILALCLVVVLAVTAVTGATLAYFTDTAEVTNTFTAGKVGLDLDENVVKKDDDQNYIQDGDERVKSNSYPDIFPGQSIFKDPTIHMDDDSKPAYVAATVTVTKANLMKLLGVDGKYVGLTGLVTGGVTTATNLELMEDTSDFGNVELAWTVNDANYPYVMTQTFDANENEYVFTYWFTNPIESGKDIILFDHIEIPETWDNTEMAYLKEMQMDIKAYATQTDSFDDVYTAITAAFADLAF